MLKISKINPINGRYMGFDMGAKNLAWAVYKKKKNFIHSSGMFLNPINDLTKSFDIQLQKFTKEFQRLLVKYRPKEIIAERFLTRGFMGNLIEKIGIMLGVMAATAKSLGIKFTLVVPSAWKNSLNRVINKKLPDIYKLFKKHIHRIDAIFMSYYIAKGNFNSLSYKKAVKQLERHFS